MGSEFWKVPEMLAVYGTEVVFLVSGGLFKHGPDVIENCRYFRSVVEQFA